MTASARAARILGVAVVCVLAGVPGKAQRQETIAGLFDQYLHGDADAAVTALAAWPAARREVETGVNPLPGDPWADAAFALFHTEVGFRVRGFGGPVTQVPGVPWHQQEVHFRTSYELIDRLAGEARNSRDDRLLAFAKSWCIVMASRQLRAHWHIADALQVGNSQLDDLVKRRFPDDAELLLMSASMEEPRVGPEIEEHDGAHFVDIHGAGPAANGVALQPTRVRTSSHGLFNYDRNAALERDLQRALDRDPALLEARLRWGRHLILMDADGPGVTALEQVVAEAPAANQTFAGYLAALFVGDWYEHHDQASKAADSYRAAIAVSPEAPAARLALGRLDITSGRADAGWAGIRRMFGEDAAAGETAMDPWVDYLSGQAWQLRARLAGLRAAAHIASSRALAATARPPDTVLRRAQPSAPTDVPPAAAPTDRFRATADGVRVDVYVTDGGRPVTGLSAADFIVRDNNVVQQIDSARNVASLSVAIVLDLSSSLSAESIDKERDAGVAIARALRPGDAASLLTFDEKIALRVRSTPRALDIERELRTLGQFPSYSVLWDATVAGAAFAVEKPGRPVVIALTDLCDNASWLTQAPQNRRPREQRTALGDLLRRTGVMLDLFAVQFPELGPGPSNALGSIDDFVVGSQAGRELPEMTGGEWFASTQPDFPSAIAAHFNEVRSGYVLTFMPAGVKQDDGWHKLTVRLKKGKGKISARPGYYASDVKR